MGKPTPVQDGGEMTQIAPARIGGQRGVVVVAQVLPILEAEPREGLLVSTAPGLPELVPADAGLLALLAVRLLRNLGAGIVRAVEGRADPPRTNTS